MSEITDKEIEQLEKEFEEALKAKPKPNRIIVDDKKVICRPKYSCSK